MRVFFCYYIFFFCVQLCVTSALLGQAHSPLTYLGIENGLSNNSVRCIYKDHNGFMWFGTYDGLNRYDGYSFKIFRNKVNDTASLPHNYINAIGEDSRHNLWVGTGQGASVYNDITGKFLPALYLPNGQKHKERIPLSINAIKTDKTGNAFIATSGGGLLMVPKDSATAIQLPCAKNENGDCRNGVQSIVIDEHQNIWLFILDLGLCRYDTGTHTIKLINNCLKSALCMETDNQGNLWIGSFDGLYQYNIQTDALVQAYREEAGGLTSKAIMSLAFDRQQKLWIGTEDGGLDILDPASRTMTYLMPGRGRGSLSSEAVFAIYEDSENRKWIGTQRGGINIIDPNKNTFQTITRDPLQGNSLISNFISSFYEDRDQNLWIGTDGGGISCWNRKQHRFTNYSHIPGQYQSLSNNSVPSFQEDYLGNLWVATFGGGINKFNKVTGTFTRYPCINHQTGVENNYVWRLYEDREKNLWATTYADGRLYRLNRATDRFEIFCPEFADLFALEEDRAGTLWAGSVYGLIKVNQQSRKFIYFDLTKPVRAIYEDKKSRLWLGMEGGGLILFDREKGRIAEQFTTQEGLCNNAVLNILEDDKGYLWLSTFYGLSRFDPRSKAFKNFYGEDGLQSDQFAYNAALRLQSGELAFGGIKGFNIFYPDRVETRHDHPPVIITGLRINNHDVAANGHYITSISGNQVEAISIPYDDAVLSVDFAALEYSAPGKISYAYYLEGWDKGWNYSNANRTASYTKLGEGHFVLHIKSTNAAGNWNPKELRLKVVVLPPWYRSWWAYTWYALLMGGAIILYQRYRANRARLRYEVKIARLNAEKEKAERETERVIAEKEKEVNEKRAAFFTNISHEFRTPLTLVINPLKDLLRRPENKSANGELHIIFQNARRLLSLVDQLLLFRKTDANADQLKIVQLDACRLCKEVYLAFVLQAKTQQVDYSFECPVEKLDIYADREKLEIILYNLVSNALKYTPQGGKITLTLRETGREAEIIVADTGVGIPKGPGDRLFERFYQVQEKGIPAKAGFGIGLYLVKHFVELHKGSIRYESEPGKGTSFFVHLKKGKEHFGPLPVFEDLHEETILSKELMEAAPEPEKKTDRREAAGPEELITDSPSILVVDDDEQMRSYLAQIFSLTYSVYAAESGEEGIHLAYQHLPDIIISDVKMPGISGIDFCKTVKGDPSLSHIPVILLTAESSLEKKLEGVEGGADDYITKPFEKELLVAKVANQLKSRSNLQNYFYNEVTLQENPLKISGEYKAFLERCIAVVEANLDDENFNVKTLASALAMSHSNLYKKVKSISGQSVNGFIRFIRLRKAAELLIHTDANVNEAAAGVGFTSVKYFREQFVKLFGMKPSEYSKKYRKAFGKSYNLNEDSYSPDS